MKLKNTVLRQFLIRMLPPGWIQHDPLTSPRTSRLNSRSSDGRRAIRSHVQWKNRCSISFALVHFQCFDVFRSARSQSTSSCYLHAICCVGSGAAAPYQALPWQLPKILTMIGVKMNLGLDNKSPTPLRPIQWWTRLQLPCMTATGHLQSRVI